jgi:hypothetical protein
MERAVLQGADWITAATRPIAEDFQARYPAVADRVHFLPTGFEPSSVAPAARPEDGTFRMVYTGRFGLSRATGTPEVFFRGLKQALESSAELAARFRLVLAGEFSAAERALWSEPPLAGCVEERGPCPYDEALSLAVGATMLLLVTPPGLRSIATRKLFDYLAARRPVFALAEGNEAARILGETHAGTCVAPDHPEAVAEALLRAFSWWRAGVLDREIPCTRNDLYRAEPHLARVLGGHVLAGLPARPPGAAPGPPHHFTPVASSEPQHGR